MEMWCAARCANKTVAVREIITYYDCAVNEPYFVDFFNHASVTGEFILSRNGRSTYSFKDGHDTNCHSMNVDCRCDKDEWYLRYWAIFLRWTS